MADILLADVGGTMTRIGLGDAAGILPGTVQSLRNAAYDTFADLVDAYLKDTHPGAVRAICAGVAGPVLAGKAQLTNHHWLIHATELARVTGADHVHLLNDLQAQAWALDDLDAATLRPLLPGRPDPDGPRLVLGLGTGCNIAVAHRTARGLFVPASEAGHTTLPDAPEFRALYDDLRGAHPHLPVEAALSGPGLVTLHRHLTGRTLTPEQIVAAAPGATMTLFTTLLGQVAGNLCLAQMATGGLYLIGGTARAIAPFIGAGFRDAFTARGPYAAILRALPVTLVTDDAAALAGLHRCLSAQLAKG